MAPSFNRANHGSEVQLRQRAINAIPIPIPIPMDITLMIRLISSWSIDERIQRRSSFPEYEEYFRNCERRTQISTAFTLEEVDLSNVPEDEDIFLSHIFEEYSLDWDCSNSKHLYGEKFSSNTAMMEPCSCCTEPLPLLICTLKDSTGNVESLDLRGITLTVDLIEAIHDYCPKICCLNLNFASFENEYVPGFFTEFLCPKIKHLLMDNLFFKYEPERVKSAVNLEKAEIILFPTENLLAHDFLAFPTEKLQFLSLKFFEDRNGSAKLPDHPVKYLEYLSQSKPTKLRGLRIISNYGDETNWQILNMTKSLPHLKGLKFNDFPLNAPLYTSPTHLFSRIIDYLPIDSRLPARKAFRPSLMNEFEASEMATQNQTSISMEKLLFPANWISADVLQLSSENSLGLRWPCTAKDHQPGEKFSSNLAMMEPCKCSEECRETALICLLKRSNGNLECLDLRGLTLTVPLIETIALYCPAICCLNITFSRFGSKQALNLFIKHLCPKLTHLAMDNLLSDPEHYTYRGIFSKAVNLDQLEFTVFSNANMTAKDFSFFESEKLSWLSLKFIAFHEAAISDAPLPDHPELYLKAFSESKAKNLKMFKLKSRHGYEDNYRIFEAAKSLQSLKLLNLNCMIGKDDTSDTHPNAWSQLECLAVDMYSSVPGFPHSATLPDYIIRILTSRLKRFKLTDFILNVDTMRMLAEKCPNLEEITLVDIEFTELISSFGDIGAAFQWWFESLKCVDTLRIEFTLKEFKGTPANVNSLEERYLFPAEQIEPLEAFLRMPHVSLKKVFLIDWPGLQFADVSKPKQIAREAGIFLYFQPYCQAPLRSRENLCHCRLHLAN